METPNFENNFEAETSDERSYVLDKDGNKIYNIYEDDMEQWNPDWKSILHKYLVEESSDKNFGEGFELADEEEVQLAEQLLGIEESGDKKSHQKIHRGSYGEYDYAPDREKRDIAFENAGIKNVDDDISVEFFRHNFVIPKGSNSQLNIKIVNLAMVGLDENKTTIRIDIPNSTIFLGEVIFEDTPRNSSSHEAYVSLSDEDKEILKNFLNNYKNNS